MLHEVLLALSGHPSPLFQSQDANGRSDTVELHALLSPSEVALLRSIGTLAEQHRQLRDLIRSIESKHQSTICRAVATSIQQTFLARLQKKILAVESKILTKDTAVVGAYDIVPLASIVAEFDDWHRLMSWLWQTASLMLTSPTDEPGCSGADVINYLRKEANTGFPEIESAAIELSRVAELAWLRQLAQWVVYGKLPAYAGSDFLVQAEQGDTKAFRKELTLTPSFVAPVTASSVMFIGTCLNRVRHSRQVPTQSISNSIDDKEMAAVHLKHLSSLPLPINQSQLSRAISSIRLSLSRNILQRLLPMTDIVRLLACLRSYFLLGQSDFATALIEEAENRLAARQQSMGRLLQQDPLKALQSLSIKDAELRQSLNSTWKRLARDEDADDHDDVLDFARKHLELGTPRGAAARSSSSESTGYRSVQLSPIAFNDLLFPTATVLSLNIQAPLDLFITERDIATYSVMNDYLLAIRRAQVRLSELWRRTNARRARSSAGSDTAHRAKNLRKVWATSSAALHFISETSAYLEGEVVNGSCYHFEAWVKKPTPHESFSDSEGNGHDAQPSDSVQRDPETLAAAHHAFLASLVYALLLTDVPYTQELRSLLGNVDALIAFFNSLLDTQQKLDVEGEEGDKSAYMVGEESRIPLELDRARKKVDSDLRSVVNRLRQLDHERIGSGRCLDVGKSESGSFEPWQGGGVDRLLMKVDFGRTQDDGYNVA